MERCEVDLIEALRARRSIGKVGGRVDDETLRELVELAVLAPNHRLTEPWRFTILRGDALRRLGEVWAEVAVRGLPLKDGEREAARAREAAKPARAPALIAVSVRTDADEEVALEDYAAAAAAVQNMLLAATARGLGAMWRTGAMAGAPEVKAFLGLAAADRIVAFVYVGEPAMEAPAVRPRALDAVVRFLS